MNPGKKTQLTVLICSALLFGLVFTSAPTLAQDSYKALKGNVSISGTSTMHDWVMKGDGLTCTTKFKVEAGKVEEVSGLQLSIPVTALKSGKGAMDKNAYAALKAEDHKQIVYALTSSKIVGNKITSSGNLTIAGVTKPMEVESTFTINADNTINTKTSTSFKMSEFNVEPPSFMFGSVTTGDAITLTFDLTFKKI